jgi:hypothetical protein
VLVLDDIQWADRDSLRSVLFVLRRMAAIPVLTVLVTRSTDVPEHFDGLLRLIDGLSGKHLPLGPLASLDVQALAAVAGVAELPALTAQQLCIHTVGSGSPCCLRPAGTRAWSVAGWHGAAILVEGSSRQHQRWATTRCSGRQAWSRV